MCVCVWCILIRSTHSSWSDWSIFKPRCRLMVTYSKWTQPYTGSRRTRDSSEETDRPSVCVCVCVCVCETGCTQGHVRPWLLEHRNVMWLIAAVAQKCLSDTHTHTHTHTRTHTRTHTHTHTHTLIWWEMTAALDPCLLFWRPSPLRTPNRAAQLTALWGNSGWIWNHTNKCYSHYFWHINIVQVVHYYLIFLGPDRKKTPSNHPQHISNCIATA